LPDGIICRCATAAPEMIKTEQISVAFRMRYLRRLENGTIARPVR
jgi:hypothetical protein